MHVERTTGSQASAFHSWRFFGIDWHRDVVEDVHNVQLEESPANKHRLNIHFDGQNNRFSRTIWIGTGNSSPSIIDFLKSQIDEKVNQANRLIASDEAGNIVFNQTAHTRGLLAGLFFFAALVIAQPIRVSGRLDLENNHLTVRQTGFLPTKQLDISMGQIENFELKKVGVQSYAVMAILKSDSPVALFKSGPGIRKRSELVDSLNLAMGQHRFK